MSKRMMNIVLGTASLIVGCLLYVLYREETYVGKLFDGMPFVELARFMAGGYSCDFLRCYLPDFVWGFSLSCYIQAIYVPDFKGSCFCCGTAFFLRIRMGNAAIPANYRRDSGLRGCFDVLFGCHFKRNNQFRRKEI